MTREEVAMKFIKCSELKADSISRIYKETEALQKLSHDNIIKFKMTFPLQSLHSMAIVMEYASGGELKEYL
jgi:MAP/microtubule affinity-regulating kinase